MSSTGPDRERVARYIEEHCIHDIMYSLLESMTTALPANPHQFIVDHMHKEYPLQVSKVAYVEAFVVEDEDEDEDEDDEEDDTVGEMQSHPAVPLGPNATRRRSGVSAERVDRAQLLANFKRPVHAKPPEVVETLRSIMSEVFLFAHLDEPQLCTLLDALFIKEFAAGEDVIVQGAEGDNFYVVYDGECDVYVAKNGEERKVISCARGDSFGELALMYGAPRAATVRAASPAVLYAIDRTTFQAMMVGAAEEKQSLHVGFIDNIQIFDVLEPGEKRMVADALSEMRYVAGDDIIKHGQAGDSFYIVSEGDVECYIPNKSGDEVIGRCVAGQYFGEIALLTNRPRACSVRAIGAVKVLRLQRKTFTRVMGPLQEILKRNMQAYNQYMGM